MKLRKCKKQNSKSDFSPGNEDIFEQLIKNGIDFDFRTNYGSSILHDAVRGGKYHYCHVQWSVFVELLWIFDLGNKKIVEIIIKKGALVNLKDKDWTPLQIAAYEGFIQYTDIIFPNSVEKVN